MPSAAGGSGTWPSRTTATSSAATGSPSPPRFSCTTGNRMARRSPSSSARPIVPRSSRCPAARSPPVSGPRLTRTSSSPEPRRSSSAPSPRIWPSGKRRLSASRSAGIPPCWSGSCPSPLPPAGPRGSSPGKETPCPFHGSGTFLESAWTRSAMPPTPPETPPSCGWRTSTPTCRHPRWPARSPMRRWRRTTPTVTCRSRVTARCARLRRSTSALWPAATTIRARNASAWRADSTASSTSCWPRWSPARRS